MQLVASSPSVRQIIADRVEEVARVKRLLLEEARVRPWVAACRVLFVVLYVMLRVMLYVSLQAVLFVVRYIALRVALHVSTLAFSIVQHGL